MVEIEVIIEAVQWNMYIYIIHFHVVLDIVTRKMVLFL